jgi:hypothetical protein
MLEQYPFVKSKVFPLLLTGLRQVENASLLKLD